MNEILLISCLIVTIVGVPSKIAIDGIKFSKKIVEENERLSSELFSKDLKLIGKEKEIKELRKAIEIRNDRELEQIREIKELHKTILFDNDILHQKTEMLDQGAERFSKDQIEIAELKEMNKALREENEYRRKRLYEKRNKRIERIRRKLKMIG